METPPEQNSPKHILNALCTDCIEEIFRKISNVNDLLQAAQVCQQFQQSAKAVFQSKSHVCKHFPLLASTCKFPYKKIGIRPFIDGKYRGVNKHVVPFDQAEEFLRVFGSQLQYLSIESTSNQELDDKLFKLIADFAGKSLKEFHARNFDIDSEQTQFQALENLFLNNSVARNFKRCSQLISLNVSCCRKENIETWFIQQMPLLVSVELVAVRNLKDDMFAEFLSLNPQLEKLWIDLRLSTSTLRTICTYSQNLVHLYVYMADAKLSSLHMLSKLQKLKTCVLLCRNAVDAMINAFATGNAPIEYLWLKGKMNAARNLKTIKTLKKMRLGIHKECFNPSVIRISIMRTQTALKELDIYKSIG